MICPHCGNKLQIEIKPAVYSKARSLPLRSKSITLESSYRSPFKNDAAALPLPANYEAESRSAGFMPSTEANVKVPLLQSLITGAFVGIPVGALAGWIGVAHGPLTLWGGLWTGLTWGSITIFSVAFFQWTSRSRDYNELLWRIESVTGLDVTGDEQIGKPEPRTVRVEVQEGKGWKFSDLPGDEQALYDFAISVVNGIVTFSERGAASRDYGVENFRRLRDVFIQRHYAEWKDPTNHQLGIVLRRSGTAVLAAIAEGPPPAQLTGEDDTGMSSNYIERGSRRESWS